MPDGRITMAVRDELQLLDPDDVCALLKVTKDWLYDQVQAERIPYRRLNNRQLRFRPSEIRDYIEGTWTPPVIEREPAPEWEPAAPRRGRPRKN
jgi:predicted DNA-binding transcriptional regulator AlpA